MVFYIDRKLVELYCVWGRGTCGHWAGCLETLITLKESQTQITQRVRLAGRLIDRNVECRDLEECKVWMKRNERSNFPCRETHKVLEMSCTVFVVEKLNWTQLLEELVLELRHMDETQLRLMEQKDSNFARAIHHRREDPFYHKRKPFGYWNKSRLCAICWLFTNCRCPHACLLFVYLTKFHFHGKEKETVIECNQSGQDYKR